ncbi:MAG: hypothetical protein WDM91_11610 [Rhizomicrobium sp.]
MKIVFWNIQKASEGKLKKNLNSAIIGSNGLGNNVADYVVKIVLDDKVWATATGVPADAFVIIELVSGGSDKGGDATGTCLPALTKLEGALNAAAVAANLNPLPTYRHIVPKITGHRETVGILYNAATLTYVSDAVMRDTDNKFLPKRSPLWAKFTVGSTTTALNLIGVHGPTSKPSSDIYTAAVSYTNKLADIAQIAQTGFIPKQATLIGGDFNCDGANTYSKSNNGKNAKISAFADLIACAYTVPLLTGTKTSLLQSADQSTKPPGYLSQPYDNIVCGALPGATVKVIDLCQNAPTWSKNAVATFNAARTVSDHLPISVNW